MFSNKFVIITILAFLCSLMASCKVGPNFYSPPAPPVRAYTESPTSQKTASTPALGQAGHAQYFADGRDIPAEWWTLFHSPIIDNFIEMGLKHSPNLEAAAAALQQAQENANAQIGTSLFPAVNLQLAAERQRFAAATIGLQRGSSTFNLFTPQVTISYTLDLFGGARRQIEALCAQVDYQNFQLEGAYLTLTSNIAKTVITIASLEAQIIATHELIRVQEGILTIVEQQFQVGGASRADVLSQETLLAQTRATLPPLMQNLAINEHSLAALVGAFPSDDIIPPVHLDQLRLPTELPISVPSLLVRQRPDVRAQEALLHAASAQIGVATANLFPQITLSGTYGWAANTIGTLFLTRTSFWNITGTLLQPIFNGGALHAKRRAAIDAYQQTGAQYRQTVLQAFENVADTLRALENDAKTLQAQMQAEVASHEALILTQQQFHVGGVNYISLLNAQKQYQQAHISRIQAQEARFIDTVALFQALGGGWWNRNLDGDNYILADLHNHDGNGQPNHNGDEKNNLITK